MGLKKASTPAVLPLPASAAPDFATLRGALQAEAPEQRRDAARALASQPQGAAMLAERLLDETDGAVREVIFTSLARIGGTDVVAGLLPLLRSEDATLRNRTLQVLAGLPDAVAPQVNALLADADGDVRIFAVNLLGELKHPLVPHWLAQVLQHEDAVNVVGAALDVAAEVGSPPLLPALGAAQQRFGAEPYIQFAAALAIERIEAA